MAPGGAFPPSNRRPTMRFLLLARARTTGTVRLLSSQAYASRTAAVDAATVTAHSIDLCDDEVLAVDLDSAGPVLVLRVPAAAPIMAPSPESDGSAPVSVPAPAAVAVPVTPAESVADPEEPGPARPLFVDGETILRLQPRFPLFGLDDDEVVEEDLAETLRRVARRMERDLTGSMGVEWAPVDDSWDARTLDDYSLAEDTHDQGSHDEGHLRRDAASRLLRDEEAPTSDAVLARYDDDPLRSDEDRTPDECDVAPDPEAAVRDANYSELAEPGRFAGGLFAGDCDVSPALEPEADPGRVKGSDEADLWREAGMTEPELDSDPGLGAVSDDAESPEMPVGPETEGETAADAGDRDADPEPAQDAEPPSVVQPEPEPYRASNVDFAIWVCADCVYQRTCRKAGVATPATCGNFQWKSF